VRPMPMPKPESAARGLTVVLNGLGSKRRDDMSRPLALITIAQ
jgi:hypothetical protein